MKFATAVCPASVSFIFKICPNTDPVKMGSIGIGATINRQVLVRVYKNTKTVIKFNGKVIDFPTVCTVIKKLTSQSVYADIRSPLPLGCGFGISGASALATAYAINELFGFKKDRKTLQIIAHTAEIENKTGLGSVATQITGGFLLKTAPGLPVRARKLFFIGQKLYGVILGKLETPKILSDQKQMQKITKTATEILKEINAFPTLTLPFILDKSYEFARVSGLINKKTGSMINNIRAHGGHATMSMLGDVILSDIIPGNLSDLKYQIEKLLITDSHAE